jgi:outer membrane immunogenic protein
MRARHSRWLLCDPFALRPKWFHRRRPSLHQLVRESGGQAGYNFQFGHWVYGFEADISWTSIDGAASQPTRAPPNTLLTTVTQGLDWLATVRGRLGLTAHDWLFYATGGLAFGDTNYRFSNTVSNGDSANASDSKVQTGWTVGAGTEYSLGHWSVKGEYLYYDLGDERLTAVGVLAGGGAAGLAFQPDFETKGHIVRAGANFFLN